MGLPEGASPETRMGNPDSSEVSGAEAPDRLNLTVLQFMKYLVWGFEPQRLAGAMV